MPKQDQTDITEFIGMMDAIDIARRQDCAVKEQLSIDDQKERIKTKLKETYKAMGVGVTDSQLHRAIEDYYSKKWKFIPPEEGLETTFR